MKGKDFFSAKVNERGMTLIDMSILTIVLGLLSVGVIQAYNSHMNVKAFKESTAKMQFSIKKALEDYYIQNAAYPCPADITLTREDPDYGRQQIDCFNTAPATDVFVSGAVPFIDLKIQEKDTFDGWSRRFNYIVSKNLTLPILDVGQLSILAVDDDNAITTLSTNAHIFIYSNGETGRGAYTAGGALAAGCPSGANQTRDSENCDNDPLFFDSSMNTRSESSGNTFYDDISMMINSYPSRIWTRNRVDQSDLVTDGINIGIANDNPEYLLDVAGNIKVESTSSTTNGNAGSTLVCNPSGENCFQPSFIAGGSICSDGAMRGIANASILCDSLSVGGAATCAPGQYLQGFDASGLAICLTIVGP